MKIAKIIFGAKNSDKALLQDLLYVYTHAGANILDICADEEIILFVKNILTSINPPQMPKICTSITLTDDIHAAKAEIIQQKCINCQKCVSACPQKTIINTHTVPKIQQAGCVGCKICEKVCPANSIKITYCNKSFENQYRAAKQTDYIEIHTNGKDSNLYEIFKFLKKDFPGDIGICISNNSNSQEKIDIIQNISKLIFPKTLIVQADGNSISGINNELSTTQKAIDECKHFQDIKNIVLIASGGTNFQTADLIQQNQINIDGIAWGSFARKILLDNRNDSQEKQIEIAKKLISTIN